MRNFYCKYCGAKFTSIQTLTINPCMRRPDGRGKHEVYEGSEKSSYICKHCGHTFKTIQQMAMSSCSLNHTGTWHEPML